MRFLKAMAIFVISGCVGTLKNMNDTATFHTEESMERIRTYDEGEAGINAVTWLNPDALSVAADLEEERRSRGMRSPIHGLTFLTKDNIDVAGIPTTAGSIALANAVPPDDAKVVARLRKSGAILLGKTNMSELALSYGRLGYSTTGGLTRNPHDLRRNASGSSSGSAAAVAAGFAHFALGTDTAGSVRAPAAATGVVGIKPTHNVTSLDGIVPLSPSLDVVGPIAQNVRLAALVLAEISSDDIRRDIENALGASQADMSNEAFSIGIVSPIPAGHPDVERAIKLAINSLHERGVQVTEIQLPEAFESLWPMLNQVVDAEFKLSLNRYLKSVKGGPSDLNELIQLSAKDSRINPHRLAGLRRAADSRESRTMELERSNLRSRINDLFETHNLDAIAFPTIACPASPLYGENDDRYKCEFEDPYTAGYIANATGFPEITVPVGLTQDDLPVGMSLLGQAHNDGRLIRLGLELEKAVPPLPAPKFAPARVN